MSTFKLTDNTPSMWHYVILILAIITGFCISIISSLNFMVVFFLTLVVIALPIAFLQPNWLIGILGIFIFFQVAVAKLTSIPDNVVMIVKRGDEILVASLFFITLLKELLKTRLFHFDPKQRRITIALIVFIGIGLLSGIVNKVSLLPMLLGIYLPVKGFFLFYVSSKMRITLIQLKKFQSLVLILFLLVFILAVIQILGINLPWGLSSSAVRSNMGLFRIGVPTSIFNHHTLFGSAMGVITCYCLGFTLQNDNKVWWILSLLFFLGVFLSTVRRDLIAIPIATLVSIVLLVPLRKIFSNNFFRKLILISLLLGLIGLFFLPQLKNMFDDLIYQYITTGNEESRLILYRTSIEIASKKPFFGIGPGQFGSWPSILYNSSVYDKFDLLNKIPVGEEMGSPYASLLGEFGILGLVAYLFFLISNFTFLIKIFRNIKDRYLKSFIFGSAILFLTLFIDTFVHFSFQDSFIGFFFFAGLGSINSIYNNNTSIRKKKFF